MDVLKELGAEDKWEAGILFIDKDESVKPIHNNKTVHLAIADFYGKPSWVKLDEPVKPIHNNKTVHLAIVDFYGRPSWVKLSDGDLIIVVRKGDYNLDSIRASQTKSD